MMKRMLLLTVALVAVAGFAYAQSAKISGTVLTSDQKAIQEAVVALLNAKDSSFVKTTMTETNGSFDLPNLKTGAYLVMVNRLGYQKQLSQVIDIQHKDVILPAFLLQESSSTNVAEVRVVARKPFVEQRIDRVVVNPDALISNAGATSLEVLEKSPGIQVDVNGNISLKGRSGVVVFVDDKPTYLSAADLANYLRSLPAGSVETIEIMTNPPAKYDAAGNAGVINIRLKKTKAKGLNGGWNLGYGQGRYLRSNNSANLNYRINALNFFGNASLNTNNSYQDLTIWREYFTPTGTRNSGFTQNSYIRREQNSANLKLGVDWYVSKKTTLGLVLTGFRNPTNTTITNNAQVFDADNTVSSRVEALSPAHKVLRNGSINLNYAYKIDSTGRELSANVDYITYQSDLNQSLTNTVFGPGKLVTQTILESLLPATITIQTAKVDYAQPLAGGGKFESGLKRSDISTDNVADFSDVVNKERQPNYEFSNNFRYNETINAAYLNYSRELGRLSVQAGLRFENTTIRGNQLGNKVVKDSSFTRAYSSLFPTVYASYKLDSAGRHQLVFSYGRRIDRPNYQDMNPFTYPLDRFTLYGGNPFLRPTFSDNFQLSHTFNNAITTTLQYSYAKDVIFETIEQGGTVFYSRPGNLGSQVSYGVSVNGAREFFPWWTLQLYTELTHNEFRATLYNQQLNNVGSYWYVAPINLFRLSKLWSAEVGGVYQTRVYAGQFVTIPVWNLRVAASRKLWKDKGTLKMNVSDVFYTNQPGGDIQSLANSTARWLSYLDSRVATVSLSYRFSNGQTLRPRQTGGADNEMKRVKG
jgi:iron complex outermembrane recepter protein